MLEWGPSASDMEAVAKGKGPPSGAFYKLVSGPWTIAKWDMSDPRYALYRGKERWPKQFGFKTAKEAMDLANDMERRGV